MPNTRDIFIDWLKDAHAMERASIDNLERQVKNLDDYPDVRAKFQEQLDLTRRQEQRLDQQLKALGTDASTIKDTITRIAGQAQAMMAGLAPDEVVKQAVTTLAYEEWEIANFRALATAADHENEPSLATMFEEMADEKADIADWLSEAIPDITRRYLDQRASA